MKIALLSYEYPPETGFGGIGTYTWYQARALSSLGHEVHVIAGATDPTPLCSSVVEGVTVWRHRADGWSMRAVEMLDRWKLWWTKNRIENALSMKAAFHHVSSEVQFDIAEMPECGADGRFINGRTRVPTVVRFHSPSRLIMPFYPLPALDRRCCPPLEETAIRRATALTSCSAFLAEQARAQLGVKEPIEVIYNGIDLELFDERTSVDVRRRFQIPEGRPIVLFTGRMEPRKGIESCLEIIEPILTEHEVAVVFAGSDLFGHMKGTIEPRLASKRLRGSFHYLGAVGLDEINALVVQSDIFLLPSLWESCPYSCLEAMAGQCAVVASNAGGLPELIEHEVSGLIVPAGEADALRDGVRRLIEEPDHATSLGRAARREVEKRFTSTAIAELSVQNYQRVIDSVH